MWSSRSRCSQRRLGTFVNWRAGSAGEHHRLTRPSSDHRRCWRPSPVNSDPIWVQDPEGYSAYCESPASGAGRNARLHRPGRRRHHDPAATASSCWRAGDLTLDLDGANPPSPPRPRAWVRISPATAAAIGVRDGEPVMIPPTAFQSCYRRRSPPPWWTAWLPN